MSPGPGSGRLPSQKTPVSSGARRSHAFEGLTQVLRRKPGLQILDYGGINQTNLDYLTGLGHRLYSEDLLRALDAEFPPAEQADGQLDFLRLTRFLEITFDRPDQSAHVALLWDTLQFLPAQAADGVLHQLRRILAPEGLMFAFFHPEMPGQSAVPHSCRIASDDHLLLVPRPPRKGVRSYNPRTIERAFTGFSSVKFYLTREKVQEVLVRR